MKFNKLLEESQFHGGRRLAEGNCRWWWSISMALLFFSAVAVVSSTVRRYFDNPTYMVHLETTSNRSQFPSVIVCPEIYYSVNSIDRFLDQVKIPSNLNITYLKSAVPALAAFYAPDLIYETQHLRNVEDLLEYNNMDVDTAARMLTTSCESTLKRCRWSGYVVNCSDLFRMELTGDGYCCVFNGRSLSRKAEDEHNVTYINNQLYTHRYGFESGLMIVVNQSQALTSVDLSYKWLSLQGSQLYVDCPINGSALNPGSEQWAEYHQHYFQIADAARSLSDSLRKCRMAQEPLRFFPVYNRKYCAVECQRAYTLKRCKCIRMVHPRARSDPYCNSHQLPCAKHAMLSFGTHECDCPLACDVATDFVKLKSFTLQEGVPTIDSFYNDIDFSKVTIVRVFLMHHRTRVDSRWSYFTNFDLFAQLGGVFNVFFGCSILTLLELAILAYRGITTKIHRARHEDKPKNKQDIKKKNLKNIKMKHTP